MVDNICVVQIARKMQRVDVCIHIRVIAAGIAIGLDMEVQVQDLDAGLLKEIIDELQRFIAVDETNFHTLDSIDADDLLQRQKNEDDEQADEKCDPVISVAAGNSHTCCVP